MTTQLASRKGTIAAVIVATGCLSLAGQNQPARTRPDGIGADVPKGWFAIPPGEVKWRKGADGSGRENALLFGDPSKPELYGTLVKWPPNTTAKAHSHPDGRYVMVLSGTFYHGHGDKFDASKLERRPSGTLFGEPAGVAHFGATKQEGAVLYFVGIGPNRTDRIEK